MPYDEPTPATCPACSPEEPSEAPLVPDEYADDDEWLPRLLDMELPQHTYAPGCRLNVWLEEGRILACGCRPAFGDYAPDPKVLLRHIAACLQGDRKDARPWSRRPPRRVTPRFKGILTGDEVRPAWFWELWVRRPHQHGSADALEW